MKFYQIGDDIFNFEYLISVRKENGNVTLVFTENQKVVVTMEDWKEIKRVTMGIVQTFGNSYKPIVKG